MDKLFFDLRATHNPHRWYLPVTPSVCVGPPDKLFMFGGIGLASAVAAMERTCERPLIWATAQYLSYARPGSVVDIDVWTPVEGKYNTQARVVSHVDDKEIITVNAALGKRDSPYSQHWTDRPEAPPPEECEPSEHWRAASEGLHSRMEVRIVKGRRGADREGNPEADGRSLVWARPREGFAIDSTMLAIMADFVPQGIGTALGKNAGGNSLDNTLRIVRIVPTRWVLADIMIQGIHGGFAHGDMRLFSEDGQLMAMASQSVIARMMD